MPHIGEVFTGKNRQQTDRQPPPDPPWAPARGKRPGKRPQHCHSTVANPDVAGMRDRDRQPTEPDGRRQPDRDDQRRPDMPEPEGQN